MNYIKIESMHSILFIPIKNYLFSKPLQGDNELFLHPLKLSKK